MKSLNIIPILDSIPKVSSFSNYGLSLEKIFKMNSLTNLIKTLKFKKDYHNQITNEFSNIKNSSEEYDVLENIIDTSIESISEEFQLSVTIFSKECLSIIE